MLLILIFLFFIFNIMRMKFTFLLLSVFIFNMLLTASCSSNIHGDLNFTISLEEGDDATSVSYTHLTLPTTSRV